MTKTFLENAWFQTQGREVQDNDATPSRMHASTLKSIAATWEHTSPSLPKGEKCQ